MTKNFKLSLPSIKFPPFLSKIVTNKYVLYVVAFLALFNLLGYVMVGKLNTAILFVALGFITTFFSRNMVVVLLVPLLLVSFFSVGKAMKEGFSDSKDDSKEEKKEEEEEEKEDSKKDDSPEPVLPDDSDDTDSLSDDSDDDNSVHAVQAPTTIGKGNEHFEVGRKKGSRIDYGSTLETAYNNLNSVLESDGISRLTEDTQRLMKQQLQLADAMKGMTPMLKQAQDMLKTLNVGDLGDLGSIVKQLGINVPGNK
jgi:hypothetical protein